MRTIAAAAAFTRQSRASINRGTDAVTRRMQRLLGHTRAAVLPQCICSVLWCERRSRCRCGAGENIVRRDQDALYSICFVGRLCSRVRPYLQCPHDWCVSSTSTGSLGRGNYRSFHVQLSSHRRTVFLFDFYFFPPEEVTRLEERGPEIQDSRLHGELIFRPLDWCALNIV